MPRKYASVQGEQGARKERAAPSEEGGARSKESHFGRNIILLLVLAGLFFFFNGFAFISSLLSPEAQTRVVVPSGPAFFAPREKVPQGVVAFASEFGDRMISYKDKFYGFEISYPVGYLALQNPDLGVYLRFQANFPGSASEVIDVRVSNETGAKEAFDSNVAEFAAPDLQSTEETTIGGRKAYLVSGKQASPLDDGTNFFVREAFFDCTGEDGAPYTAAIVAVIPEEFEPDVLLASYMIRNFKC